MNTFLEILNWASQSDDEVVKKIVTKINQGRCQYDAFTTINNFKNIHDDDMNNAMVGYDRGLKGEDGYNPAMIYSEIPDPYRKKQDILIRITGLFEVLEELYLEQKK